MFTWIEVSRAALEHNIRAFRKLVGPNVELMPVIKSNAYGHDFLKIAQLCQKNKAVNRLCVVSLEEALVLRQKKITKPIIILAIYELDKKKLTEAIAHNITFPLYTLEQARLLNTIGKQLKKKVMVHFKIDIGTSRIGILMNELPRFLKQLKSYQYLNYEGVFGHFASSEDDPKRTREQHALFKKVLTILTKHGFSVPVRHVACSASTTLYPKMHYTAVRVGLSIYGLDPAPATKREIILRPILSWYTKIIQIKTIPRGTKISYGGTFTTTRTTKLATIPVGYWDGYDRSFSNKASALVHGKRCPVRGRVCMNLTMIDVTGIQNVKAGDKVNLIGKKGREQITADELAKISTTINYEIVTRINPLIPRLIV